MEEPAKASLYVDCGCCGKATFIDLLDASTVCEYCAEVRRTRSHYLPKKDARNNKGRRSRDNRGVVAAVNDRIDPPGAPPASRSY